MSELWVRTRFHEAGHSVVAWCCGNRPEVVGPITVARENGRVVARAGVHTDHVSPNQLSLVGLAGLLAEAKAAVEKKHGRPAAFRSLTGLAYQIRGCVEQRLANLVPIDAWPINVDVAPEPKMTTAVLTADDLWFVAARGDFTEVLSDLLKETAGLLMGDDVWAAVEAVASLIPKKEGAVVPEKVIRELLHERLPRK